MYFVRKSHFLDIIHRKNLYYHTQNITIMRCCLILFKTDTAINIPVQVLYACLR